MFITRLLAALVFAPALLAAVWFGEVWLQAAMALLSILALYEYQQLVFGKGEPYLKAVGFGLGALLIALLLGWLPQGPIFMALAVPVALLAVMLRPEPIPSSMQRAGLLVLGVLYGAGLMPYLYLLRQTPNGLGLAIMALFCTWASDTGAYFAGKALVGRHKLYPKVSPGKTVEGLVGGLVAAVAMAFLIVFLLHMSLPVWATVSVGAIAALFGTAGDLCESMLKRSVGAKDSSRLIPGHGGVLDRFDAVMFVAPAVYALSSLL